MTTLDITRTIDIKAAPEKVWAALTESDLITQWFGDSCEFDASPGGTGHFGWTDHGAEFRVVVELVDKPRTLVYRWARESGVDPVRGNSTVVAENAGGWTAELAELVEFAERT